MYLVTSSAAKAENDRFASLVTDKLSDQEKQSLVALALDLLHEQHQPGQVVSSPGDSEQYLRLRLADCKAEVFGCLYLDSQHRILEMCELFQGTIDSASVHPRIVVQQGLAKNAAAVVIYHNHVSGVAEPSQADQLITKRLQEALALVDIRLLDHLVVTCNESVSFANRGWI